MVMVIIYGNVMVWIYDKCNIDIIWWCNIKYMLMIIIYDDGNGNIIWQL